MNKTACHFLLNVVLLPLTCISLIKKRHHAATQKELTSYIGKSHKCHAYINLSYKTNQTASDCGKR